MSTNLSYDGGLTCAMEVRDLKAAIAWYGDVMGFTLLYEMEQMKWCELATPVARVNVGLAQSDKQSSHGGATLTFGVKDIDVSRKQLEARKVRFDGPTQTIEGMVKLATFHDPDGNTLMLYQTLQK